MQPKEPIQRPSLKEDIKSISKEAGYLSLVFVFLGSEVTLSALIVFLTKYSVI